MLENPISHPPETESGRVLPLDVVHVCFLTSGKKAESFSRSRLRDSVSGLKICFPGYYPRWNELGNYIRKILSRMVDIRRRINVCMNVCNGDILERDDTIVVI